MAGQPTTTAPSFTENQVSWRIRIHRNRDCVLRHHTGAWPKLAGPTLMAITRACCALTGGEPPLTLRVISLIGWWRERMCSTLAAVRGRSRSTSPAGWRPDEWLALTAPPNWSRWRVARLRVSPTSSFERVMSISCPPLMPPGFSEVVPSASVWCFATPEDRGWWAGMWADRVVGSAFTEHVVEQEVASRADLERIAQAWRRWAAAGDGWFVLVHGEVLCTP